jgi:hypothetical protein
MEGGREGGNQKKEGGIRMARIEIDLGMEVYVLSIWVGLGLALVGAAMVRYEEWDERRAEREVMLRN